MITLGTRKPHIVNLSVLIFSAQVWPHSIFFGHEKFIEGYANCPFARELEPPLFPFRRKTMEVFNMNKYEIYQIRKAIEACNGTNEAHKRNPVFIIRYISYSG